MFLFAAGRCGNTKELKCENAGIKLGKRETIEVDANYRTNIPHIYAVGDVVGFPSLASTSMDQGRVAVTHMFNTGDLDHLATVFPYGIYTIPEISMVGITEEEAKKNNMNYCTGLARHADLPRGKIMGAKEGMLKLIFTRDDLIIRGVHIIGPLASEIIHYGMTLVENKRTLLQVISTVFNYPTLHDLYKYACYDGLGNLNHHKIKP
jgi:NAD(P) transhydrogenase